MTKERVFAEGQLVLKQQTMSGEVWQDHLNFHQNGKDSL